MMIKCNKLTISIINKKKIVENLSFVLNDNDKLAIIGEEGNGKSTLLKYFYNKDTVSSYTNYTGEFWPAKEQLGYLPQILDHRWSDNTVEEYIFTDGLHEEINFDLYNEYTKIERFFIDFKIDHLLCGDQKIRTLSGGEKIKIQLIKLLIHHPKGLLLDEPTNDLDLQTYLWLENFLKTVSIPIIFVSHDIKFLEHIANKILHLEQLKNQTEAKWTYYVGGYDSYIKDREISFAKQTAEHIRTKAEKERKEEILRHQHLLVENDLDRAVRNPGWGRVLAKKMKNVKSQEAKMKNFEVVETPLPQKTINFFFEKVDVPAKKCILNLENSTIKIKDKTLIDNVNIKIYGPEHIVFIGNNGCGKTTLIKYILPELEKLNLKTGYMPQNYDEDLNLNITPIQYLQQFVGSGRELLSKIMSYLGAMNFIDEEMKTKISLLSGGQKAKLYMTKLNLLKCDVLVLDEPTRNLSPISIPIIINILREYQGAIISISHDRNFIDSMNKIYEIKDKRLILIKS